MRDWRVDGRNQWFTAGINTVTIPPVRLRLTTSLYTREAGHGQKPLVRVTAPQGRRNHPISTMTEPFIISPSFVELPNILLVTSSKVSVLLSVSTT